MKVFPFDFIAVVYVFAVIKLVADTFGYPIPETIDVFAGMLVGVGMTMAINFAYNNLMYED